MLLPKQAAASARYFEVFKIPAKVAQSMDVFEIVLIKLEQCT